MRFDPISFLKIHEPKPLGHKILQQKLFWNFFYWKFTHANDFKVKAIGLCKFLKLNKFQHSLYSSENET
jgi:hypothetical protein